jgi:hypothetical protein
MYINSNDLLRTRNETKREEHMDTQVEGSSIGLRDKFNRSVSDLDLRYRTKRPHDPHHE